MSQFNPKTYAIYQASKTQGQSAQPCIHMLASVYNGPENLFQMVETKCTLCGKQHNFTLQKTYPVNTPGQAKSFEAYCEARSIEIV